MIHIANKNMLRDIKDTKIRKMMSCLFRYTDWKKNIITIFLLQFFIQNI
jgi:hypothetical protein